MRVEIELPRAFSVRDDHEFLPIRHLVGRLNPRLLVTQVATGRHVQGGHTVFWGLVHHESQDISRKDVETALRQAGFDFGHNVLIQMSALNGHSAGGAK